MNYTELALFAQIDADGTLSLVNNLGIKLGNDPEEILENLENNLFHFNIVSERRPGVFPFNYNGVSHDMCTFYQADNVDNDEVVDNIDVSRLL